MSLPMICPLGADRHRPAHGGGSTRHSDDHVHESFEALPPDADRRRPAHGGARQDIAMTTCMSLSKLYRLMQIDAGLHIGITIRAWEQRSNPSCLLYLTLLAEMYR